MTPVETPCIAHEEQIQQNARNIAELKARADYKDKRIDELKKDMKDLNDKMDKLSNDVNEAIRKSITGDNEIDRRVTSLETTVKVLKWIIGLLFGSGIVWVIYSIIH